MNKEAKILEIIIEECRTHDRRLNFAYQKIQPLFPIDVHGLGGLKEEEISFIDQYVFRFSKLQDAIGQKLFKAVLRTLGEPVRDKPFIDLFHRLEQMGAVEAYKKWESLRIIRNDIAHEYNENKPELAQKLNAIVGSKAVLESYLDSILGFLDKRGK